MPVRIITEEKHRLICKRNEMKIQQKFGPSAWMTIAQFQSELAAGIAEVIRAGELFIDRLVLESQEKPLTPELEEAAAGLPSLKDLMRHRCAEVMRCEVGLLFLPWTSEDDGSTQFAVELASFPKTGRMELLGHLTAWQLPIIRSMLQKLMNPNGNQAG